MTTKTMKVAPHLENIVQNGDAVLRAKAKTVAPDEVKSAHIQKIIADMRATMEPIKDGIAIAAPQIGHSVRIFMVNGPLLKQADKTYKGDTGFMVFINPEIVKQSRDKKEVEEGCLSVRWLYGKVKRATRVTLEALDENGNKIERGASGLLAQIFQHECDHLNGILFIDKARELWEMSEEEIADMQK